MKRTLFQVAVAIDVSGGDVPWRQAGGKPPLSEERPVAPAQERGDIPRASVGRGEVHVAVSVQVDILEGDGLRPGCLADASDSAQFGELDVLGELVDRCRARGTRQIRARSEADERWLFERTSGRDSFHP